MEPSVLLQKAPLRTLHQINVDLEKWQFFVESNLPTPWFGSVYVNFGQCNIGTVPLPEGVRLSEAFVIDVIDSLLENIQEGWSGSWNIMGFEDNFHFRTLKLN